MRRRTKAVSLKRLAICQCNFSRTGPDKKFSYAKSVVSSPQFINVVVSIKMKQDLVTLAQMDACEKLNAFPAHEKEALYGTFPRTPAAFSNLLAFWLLQLSEMNQANFVGENTNEPNSLYKEMIQDIPLVVLSTTPCTHVLVYRGRNTWDRRLQDTNFGCSFVLKYHYFLAGAVKRFVVVHLSALCRTRMTCCAAGATDETSVSYFARFF